MAPKLPWSDRSHQPDNALGAAFLALAVAAVGYAGRTRRRGPWHELVQVRLLRAHRAAARPRACASQVTTDQPLDRHELGLRFELRLQQPQFDLARLALRTDGERQLAAPLAVSGQRRLDCGPGLRCGRGEWRRRSCRPGCGLPTSSK